MTDIKIDAKNIDVHYLNEVLCKREKEIEEGKNLATSPPMYVVLSMFALYCEGHSDMSGLSQGNLRGKNPEFGYLDRADSEPEFEECKRGMCRPESVTRFWIDRPTAFFLTSEGAHDYLKYQHHNLTHGYVYVFSTGYSNREMEQIFNPRAGLRNENRQ